jgi:hypothetical protein
MHFVPNPSFRWIAASVAATYCAILFAVLFKIAPSRPPDVSDKFPPSIKLALACPVMAYFVYVCFYMSLPAVYTQEFGSWVQRNYQIEGLKKGGAKATLCPYRLHLRGARTVLDSSFCVSPEFAMSHSPGQEIVLTGKQSYFGLRFENAE